MTVKRFRRWLVECWWWFAEGKIVFVCIVVIGAAVAIGIYTFRSEASIRLTGYFLQLIGMVFAIRGLLCVRAHFGQPSLKQGLVDWLIKFPKWNHDHVVEADVKMGVLTGFKADVEVWATDQPDKSLKERLDDVVANQGWLRAQFREQRISVAVLENRHKEHEKETAQRDKEIEEELRNDLESLHTSDLLISLVGLVWVTVGITMSTMAPEIYQWLK